MAVLTHGSLFSGIGGFDLAAEWMGWENKFHCEWNTFGQRVLHHYWPNAEQFTDITKSDFTKYANRIDILTGGFPCQPYSLAGKRKGKEDERHLWPQMLRAIREIQPRWVVGENVLGIVNWDAGLVFNEVQADLEAAGYEVWPYVLPAVSVNAPHRRDRVWFVAFKNANNDGRECKFREKESCEREQRNTCSRDNERVRTNDDKIEVTTNPNSNGLNRSNSEHEINPSERGEYAQRDIEPTTLHTNNEGLERIENIGSIASIGQKRNEQFTRHIPSTWQNFPTQPPICTGNDGLPSKLDGITFSKWRNESIKAAGNAIVPQVALQIFKAINQYESNHRH
jgi:DNA (cytosine-5)-methyltransferase 1